MTRAFTIIDSFRVTEALRDRLDGLALGTWFVLNGSFQSAADLPALGTSVVVLTPGGEQIRTSVAT